ncbi:VCBS repeat-containing protein, partial [bacterium]|nr:VCBS repeat-containing protein [bacterium]
TPTLAVDRGTDTLEIVENWCYEPFGQLTGCYGIEVAQSIKPFPEIICSDGYSGLAIITNDFGPNGYSVKWRSGQLGSDSFNWILLVDYEVMESFGRDQIVVVNEQGVFLFDRQTRSLLNEIELVNKLEGACIGDYGNDGSPDVFLATKYDGIQIMSLDSFQVIQTYDYNAASMIVGQFDSDPGFELAFSGGYSAEGGYVIDLATDAIQWVYYPDFGINLKAGDLDQDGIDELVTMSNWYHVKAFDIDEETIKWELETFDNGKIEIVDLEDDGHLEILLSEGQWGMIHCYNGATGDELWTMSKYGHGSGDLTAADVDNDGKKEIIWNTGSADMDGKQFYVGNYETNELEWRNLDPKTPWNGIDVADIDLDGTKEIVIGSHESNDRYDSGMVFVFDAVTHRLERVHENDEWDGLRYLCLENVVETSPLPEMITITDVLRVKDPITNTEIWSTAADIGCVVCTDIDDDGSIELVTAGGQSYNNHHIIVYTGQNGNIEWESSALNGYSRHIEVADIDNDNIKEIGVLSSGKIQVLNGMSYTFDWESSSNNCSAFTFADVYGEIPGTELVYGSDDDTIVILNSIDYTEINTFDLTNGEILALQVADVDKNGTLELCISIEGYLIITNPLGETLWTSPALGGETAPVTKVLCDDINNDNVNELLLGMGSKLVEFRISEPSSEPTPVCEETGVTLSLPRESFSPGEVFSLDATICNNSDDMLYGTHIFVLMDIYGEFWCGPSWISLEEGVDAYTYSIPQEGWQFYVFPGFVWPEIQGHATGLKFWGAIVNNQMTDVIGEISQVQFSW